MFSKLCPSPGLHHHSLVSCRHMVVITPAAEWSAGGTVARPLLAAATTSGLQLSASSCPPPAVRLQLSASSLLAFTDVSCHLSPLGRKTTVPSLTQIIPFLLLMSVKYIMQNHRLHIFRRCYPFFSRDTRSRNVVLCQPNLFFETDIVLIVSVGKSFKKNTFPSKHRI